MRNQLLKIAALVLVGTVSFQECEALKSQSNGSAINKLLSQSKATTAQVESCPDGACDHPCNLKCAHPQEDFDVADAAGVHWDSKIEKYTDQIASLTVQVTTLNGQVSDGKDAQTRIQGQLDTCKGDLSTS